MPSLRHTLWWIGFLVTGILLQTFLPGLDAMLLGILMLNDSRDYRTMVWFMPAVVLLQEGTGTQAFGASVLFISLCLVFQRLLQPVALASRSGAMLLLCATAGCMLMLVTWLFAIMEGLCVTTNDILFAGLCETLYLLVGWTLLQRLLQKIHRRVGYGQN